MTRLRQQLRSSQSHRDSRQRADANWLLFAAHAAHLQLHAMEPAHRNAAGRKGGPSPSGAKTVTGQAIHNQIALTSLDECAQIHTPYIFLLIPRPLLEDELRRMTFIPSDPAFLMPQSCGGPPRSGICRAGRVTAPEAPAEGKGKGGSAAHHGFYIPR